MHNARGLTDGLPALGIPEARAKIVTKPASKPKSTGFLTSIAFGLLFLFVFSMPLENALFFQWSEHSGAWWDWRLSGSASCRCSRPPSFARRLIMHLLLAAFVGWSCLTYFWNFGTRRDRDSDHYVCPAAGAGVDDLAARSRTYAAGDADEGLPAGRYGVRARDVDDAQFAGWRRARGGLQHEPERHRVADGFGNSDCAVLGGDRKTSLAGVGVPAGDDHRERGVVPHGIARRAGFLLHRDADDSADDFEVVLQAEAGNARSPRGRRNRNRFGWFRRLRERISSTGT